MKSRSSYHYRPTSWDCVACEWYILLSSCKIENDFLFILKILMQINFLKNYHLLGHPSVFFETCQKWNFPTLTLRWQPIKPRGNQVITHKLQSTFIKFEVEFYILKFKKLNFTSKRLVLFAKPYHPLVWEAGLAKCIHTHTHQNGRVSLKDLN